MLCRALLTIIVVSYLICVLILSGLQKEDLDVNMLKKLQRHGFNIDDMNNESLREDCLKSANSTHDEKSVKTESQVTVSTTENTLQREINQQQNNITLEDNNKTNLESLIKSFIESQNSRDKTKKETFKEFNTRNVIFEDYNIPQSSNLKYIFSDTIGYNSPPLKKMHLQSQTTEGTFHLFSQNVLRLWNTYSKQDIKDIAISSEPTTIQTSANPIEIKNNSNNAKDWQYINKIIADYISKHQTTSTTVSLPPSRDLDVDRMSDLIRRFVADSRGASQENMLQNNDSNSHSVKKSTKKQSNDVDINDKREPNVQNITNLMHNVSNGLFIDNNKLLEEGINLNNINNLYANIQKDSKKSENETPLHNDLIQQLAESVKAIVIRDLKKEISTITPETTLMTTQKSSTVTLKSVNDKPTEAVGVMDKIMELFQQIKSIKEKTIIAGNSKLLVTEKKDIQHEYKGPIKVLYKPAISPYGVRSPTEQISPIYVKQFNQEANLNVPNYNGVQNHVYQVNPMDKFNARSPGEQNSPLYIEQYTHKPILNVPNQNGPSNVPNPVYQIHPIGVLNRKDGRIQSPAEQMSPIYVKQYNYETNLDVPNGASNLQNFQYQAHHIDNIHGKDVKDGLRLSPITIQTNSFEVPPLNIPILKPIGMVNQNIIVTTGSPNLRPRLDTHHTNYIHHIDRYKIEDDFKTRNNWHKPSQSPERQYKPHSRYNYDRPKYGNYNNGYERNYYKPHFNKSDYDRMRLRNQEIKRFHERLEKIDEARSSDDREDCCKLKVASRQQLPLSEAKKRSRYDDIPFKNFLQTQQKVNDMLEKILATKTKSEGPRSVETT